MILIVNDPIIGHMSLRLVLYRPQLVNNNLTKLEKYCLGNKSTEKQIYKSMVKRRHPNGYCKGDNQ